MECHPEKYPSNLTKSKKSYDINTFMHFVSIFHGTHKMSLSLIAFFLLLSCRVSISSVSIVLGNVIKSA